MTIYINVSPKKRKILGKAIADAFGLRPTRKGYYKFVDVEVSEEGLGSSILLTVQDTITHSEKELKNMLRK